MSAFLDGGPAKPEMVIFTADLSCNLITKSNRKRKEDKAAVVYILARTHVPTYDKQEWGVSSI